MNPAIAALLVQAEAMGIKIAEACVVRFLTNLSKGMSVGDAAADLAMWAAEQQALLVDQVVS